MFTRRPTTATSSTAAASATSSNATTTTQSLFARPVRNSIRPPSAISRQQHIDSYLQDPQLAPSTRKVSVNDDSTFDTVFQSVAGDTLILRVHWPSSSAGSKPPAMTLAGVEAEHAWLDGRMRVTGYSPVTTEASWRESNILLGAAVHAVIKYLQLNSPRILRFLDPGLIAIQAKPPKHPAINGGTNGRHQAAPPPPAYEDSMIMTTATEPTVAVNMPKVPSRFPELEGLSRERLEELKNDELEFQAFCNQLPIISKFTELQQETLLENAQKAESRLDQKKELRELHTTVAKLQKDLAEKVKVFQALEQEQDKICKPPERNKVRRELARAKKVAFEASEKLADEWLESNEIDADAFVDAFVEARKVHHVRAAKLEALESKRFR